MKTSFETTASRAVSEPVPIPQCGTRDDTSCSVVGVEAAVPPPTCVFATWARLAVQCGGCGNFISEFAAVDSRPWSPLAPPKAGKRAVSGDTAYNRPNSVMGFDVARPSAAADGAIGLISFLGIIAVSFAVTFAADRPSEAVIPEHLNEQTLRATKNGLDYLVNTQQANGAWFNAGGYGSYPTAMTALAGTALLCSGSTPKAGPYAPTLKRAAQYLLECAEANPSGLITSASDGRSMHGHGFAMLFLAECYGDELDVKTQERIRRALEKAVALTAKSQSHAGGWLYTPDANGDEGSVTVTQLQGLRACRNAGIKVPPSTIDRAVKYLEICQNPDGGISYSANSLGQSRPAISAAAVATLYAAGQYDSKMAGKCLEYVVGANSPTRNEGGHYFYTQLYMAQALYQVHDQSYVKYFPQLRDYLLAQQAADGSWVGDGIGPVYGTAIACIILQLPFDYLPIYQR